MICILILIIENIIISAPASNETRRMTTVR